MSDKRLICLDLDGTLTQHKTPLCQKNRTVLDKLQKRYKTLIVGAGNAERIYRQMGQYPIDIIANYGMQESRIIDGRFIIIRNDRIDIDKAAFYEKCMLLRKKYGYTEYSGDHIEFHPSGMVTFSLLGSGADINEKIKFDPDRSKRRILFDDVKKYFPDYTVFIGGSSSFDFAPVQYNKYDAIMRYAKENGYNKEEILYIGDDFEEGGGDSHVRIGGIDWIFVDNYENLHSILTGHKII